MVRHLPHVLYFGTHGDGHPAEGPLGDRRRRYVASQDDWSCRCSADGWDFKAAINSCSVRVRHGSRV